MASSPSWDPGSTPEDLVANYSDWDVVFLLGKPLPGAATLTGQRHQRIDRKASPGSDSDTMTSVGTEPAVITITLKLWTDEQRRSWESWVPLLEPRPGKPRKDPVAIYHPALAPHRITKAWLKTVGFLEPSPGEKGVFRVRVEFYEWAPPNPFALKTPLKGNADMGSVKQALPAAKKPTDSENHP